MEIALLASQRDGAIDIEYALANTTARPILVFDRLYSMAEKRMDSNWAYVSLEGGRALIRRALCELPRGLHHENPEVPYGRQVEAGQTATGQFRLGLPLRDRGPYLKFGRPGIETQATVQEVMFVLGWCPAPDPARMPPGIQPIEWEGERLWLFPYDLLRVTQKLSTASTRLPGVPGLVLQH